MTTARQKSIRRNPLVRGAIKDGKSKSGKWEVVVLDNGTRGYFEHDDYGEAGGLWFTANVLVDQDGTFSLPLPVARVLRDHFKVIVPSSYLDDEEKWKKESPGVPRFADDVMDNPRKRRRNPVENRKYSMKAIMTKVLPASNTRPMRIKAYDKDGNAVTISYDYEGVYEASVKAAEALQEKMKWKGTLVGGATNDGYAFCFRDTYSK